MLGIKRREFIAAFGGAAVWSVSARAQQQRMPLIGFINAGTADGYRPMVAAFQEGLKELGYTIGENVAIEYRWADGRYDRLAALAADLIRQRVTVIAGSLQAAIAAKAQTATIPIVFSAASDPVEVGLVSSLSRPGGNVTGVTSMAVELGPKRLALLHELVPEATTVAALLNPNVPSAKRMSSDLSRAALTLRLQLHLLHASSQDEFEPAFATAVRLRSAGLVISADPLFNASVERLATLAVRYAIPAIYQYREFTAAGALMSYGTSITDQYRLVGIYTGRILKGEKPAELPVQQSTKIDLAINLRSAKLLGLNVPLTLRALATEVIV